MLMRNNFLSKAVPRGTRTIWRYLSALILLFTFSIGQMWAADPIENVGTYSTQVISADGKTSTWTFIQPSSQVTVPNAETGDVDVIYVPSGSSKMKFSSGNAFSWSGTSSGYFYVPSGAAGTISMTVKSSSDSRYLQLYVAGSAAADSKRLWSKYNATPTSDGKKGPQSFSFTSDDLTTKGTKTYLHFKDNNTEMKIASISVTLTTGSYLSSGPVDPTASFSDGAYTIGGADLDLSSLFTTNSDGAVTYTITAQGTTDAALRADGKSLYATTAGSATVKVEQAATSSYNAFNATATITVSAFVPITSISLDYNEQHIYVGDVITITPTILPANASNKTLLWSVTSGASITQDGVLTAEAESDVYVTAAAQDGSDKEGTSHIFIDALPTCATLTPAESGAAIEAGDAIDLQELAPNASMRALTTNLSYTADGLLFGSSSSTKAEVTLNNLMQVGTVITATIYNADASKARGLKLLNNSGTSKATWTKQATGDHVETYTVVAGDGLAGSNVFQLQRAENAYLKNISVANCGAELLDLSSAVTPDHDPAYATVTLSATKVVAGGSATATYSIADLTVWDFDGWEITSGDATIADPTAATAAITMGTTASVITLKLKAASTKHTVTYYDGITELGTELVVEGENPTAAEIVVPHKLGYAFAGWSTTDGGAVVALNTISVAADMQLYAVYNAVNCNALSGKIFEVNINVAPAANCTIRSGSGYETSADLIKYGTVSGGIAIAENSSTSNHLIITTTPTVKFAGGNGYVHISFDCALKVGDKIKTTIASQNIAYTTTSSRSTTNYFTKGTDQELTITSGHALENATEIYLWAASSNGGELTSLQVIRPEKFEVTFNMHGHGDAVDPQSVVEGGKVTKPTDPTASGWDFGGWFTDDTYGTTWDFENMTISAATEIHALWTAHTTSSDATLSSLTVNGVAITLEDGVFGYAFELPMGTTALPTIVAVANDPNSKGVSVLQTNIGSATITVTAEDDSFKVYTISFTVATSKDIELVWDKSKQRCDATTPAAVVKSDDATVSTYINKMTFTGGGEGSSLNVGNTAGNMVTLTAKPGYAISAMSFYGKIEADDAKLEYSLNGGAWTDLASTNAGDACYADVFTAAEVHELRMRSAGNKGFWIRNMQLTMIEACTPIVVAWDEEPVEFEVSKAGYVIAATANNGGAITYASADNTVIDVNASTGALTIAGLGSVALSASTPEGDGTTYCANGGDPIVLSKTVNTYYLVTFDGQNGEAADEVKYFSGDAAIAQPTDPSFPGHTFQGWFDAASAGNPVAFPLTPSASRTIYAQWTADCAGATITTQPVGTSYLTGRTATALVCEATAGAGGALTYEWFTCDDEYKANPVAATATPSTAVAGTFYYFCKVTEEGCAVEAFSDVVTITVTDKTPICLIATTVTGATAHGAVTGLYGEDKGGSADVNVSSSSYKMDKGKYIGVTLPDGYMFQEGDKVVLNVMTVNNATGFTLFDGHEDGKNLIVDTRDGALVPAGANTVVLPAYAGSQSVYVLREDNSTTGNLNSAIDAIAVYRACSPILNKVTVNGAEGKPNALNQVVFEVAASTTQSQLEAIAFDWVSNDDAWTAANAPVAANAWEFGVVNTVTFTDKDGDQSVYTITVNKAAASTNVELATLTVNGSAVTVVPGQAEYNYELPYGTSAAPVVAATAEDANAEVGTITQASSATGSATFTVTAEDGTTTRDYTINFSVSKWKEIVIWDGSTMSAVATSPDATTGMAWETVGFSSISSYTTTCGEKSYSKCLPSGGAATSRYMTLTVPAGYVAKFYVVMASHSDGSERGMFIGSNLVKNPDATSVLELSNNDRDIAVAGMSEVAGAGTWYINPNASIDFQEIRAYLRPGYARTAMLGNGVLGTVCVDHNVAVEDIQGATMYELMGRENTYGKLAFDEIVSGELEAGAPYVFQAHGDKLILFFGETKVDDPVDKGNGMYGTFVDQTLYDLTDVYYFAQKALWSCVDLTELSLPANRAYVKLSEIDYLTDPNPAPGRRRILLSVNGENQTQGVDNLESGDAPVKVMIDGTLYIIRGEKVFDATGRLVK